ncbi:hypothetical protein P3W55_02035 [Pseudomonas citronellolis]|uniref:Uncharacterized protein n=1 Tax=Pseudomonas citronellolis TaxID=53408 RepID=A0AAW6P0R8_9PSED|nr:hypothetical protein [Pseudomonas citronellolis]MDF3840484.1 hypothetical protein [Pseudomonas citronellolis]WRT82943.1 hypothetical protein VK748_00460 [Pseudomonas citronellolis]
MSQPEVFKGIGIVSMQKLGVENAPMRDAGDVEQLKIAHRTNSITWKQHRRPGGGNLSKLDTPEGIDLTVQMQEWTDENLAMSLQGTVVELEPETVTGEAVVLIPGSLVVTDFPGPTSLVITKTQGSTPVPLTEVEASAAGFRVKAGSTAITEPTPATIAYTSTKAVRIEPLVEAGAEYKVVFDGLNEAPGGRPVVVTIWRWKAPPAEELALIDAENPGKLLSKGEILADPSRPANESPFYRIDRL